MKPKRIQRKRTAGWKMPENTVYVGRPTAWGNPYNWKKAMVDSGYTELQAKKMAVEEFRLNLKPSFIAAVKHHLKGKNLACFCKVGDYCHADVLLEIANQ